MSIKTWRHRAAAVIREVLHECKTMGMTPEDTIKEVDANYPFGQREYWPYKAWLRARRELCGHLPGVRPWTAPKPRKKKRRHADTPERQESPQPEDMFGGD